MKKVVRKKCRNCENLVYNIIYDTYICNGPGAEYCLGKNRVYKLEEEE